MCYGQQRHYCSLIQSKDRGQSAASDRHLSPNWSIQSLRVKVTPVWHLSSVPSTTPRVLPLWKTYASTAKVYKIRRAISAQHTAGISAESSNAVSLISFTCMTHWWCICSSNFSRNQKGNNYLNQHFFHWTDRKKQTETSWLQPWADREEITARTRLFKHPKQLYNSICFQKKIGIMMQKEGCREGVRMHGKQRSLGDTHTLCHHFKPLYRYQGYISVNGLIWTGTFSSKSWPFPDLLSNNLH